MASAQNPYIRPAVSNISDSNDGSNSTTSATHNHTLPQPNSNASNNTQEAAAAAAAAAASSQARMGKSDKTQEGYDTGRKWLNKYLSSTENSEWNIKYNQHDPRSLDELTYAYVEEERMPIFLNA